MQAVWALGEATAERVRETLGEPLHDSTIRTVLRILETKGYLTHETQGKAYVYRATVPRERAQGVAVRDLLSRLFGGRAEDLVLRLIEDEQLTTQQIETLQARVSNPTEPNSSPRKGRRQ
jgi:predicted transcriptional regulator